MAAREDDGFSSSHWVLTEFSSGLALKVRTGQIGLDHRAAALSLFSREFAGSHTVLPISDTHFRVASGFIDQFELGLRSGDALHLAIAAAHGETVITLDRKMAVAGARLGMSTLLI